MLVTSRRLVLFSGMLVVAGLLLLSYAVVLLEKNPLTAKEFFAEAEVRVVLAGNITSTRVAGENTFVTLETHCDLPGILFEKQEIALGPAVVTGTKKYYKGMPEILIDDIHYETIS